MFLNYFREFLLSKKFPYLAGAIILVLVFLMISSLFPGNQTKDELSDQGGGLFGLSNVFNTQKGLADKLQQNIVDQNKVSEEFANFENKVAGRYPWRKKLPLTSDKYFVYFDLNKKVFIGRLYPDNDDLIEQIKAEVIRRLKKEDKIPLESYTLDWDIYPKSSI